MKCHVKRQSPSKPDKKVHQTSGAHQRFAEDGDESDDSIFIVERVELSVAMKPDLPLPHPSPFTQSTALQLQLSWILERLAVQCPIQIC